jgi:hypothetical protein
LICGGIDGLGGWGSAISVEEEEVEVQSFVAADEILCELVEEFPGRLPEEAYVGFGEGVAVPYPSFASFRCTGSKALTGPARFAGESIPPGRRVYEETNE